MIPEARLNPAIARRRILSYSIGAVLNVNNAKIVDSTGILAYFLTYYGMICRSYALNLKFCMGKITGRFECELLILECK